MKDLEIFVENLGEIWSVAKMILKFWRVSSVGKAMWGKQTER